MSKNFEEFLKTIEKSEDASLPISVISLSSVENTLKIQVIELLTCKSITIDNKENFAEEVSGLVRNREFVSEFSNRIGVPMEDENEDEFVMRGSGVLREMLYKRFRIEE